MTVIGFLLALATLIIPGFLSLLCEHLAVSEQGVGIGSLMAYMQITSRIIGPIALSLLYEKYQALHQFFFCFFDFCFFFVFFV